MTFSNLAFPNYVQVLKVIKKMYNLFSITHIGYILSNSYYQLFSKIWNKYHKFKIASIMQYIIIIYCDSFILLWCLFVQNRKKLLIMKSWHLKIFWSMNSSIQSVFHIMQLMQYLIIFVMYSTTVRCLIAVFAYL